MNMDKFALQEDQYRFPYHHIPHFDENGIPRRMRYLAWGFEYLCYMGHVKEFVLAQTPQSLLDIGCGDGYFLGTLRGRVPVMRGIDLSKTAIDLARAFHPDIDYQCIDAADLSEQYDIVTAIEVIEHIADEDMAAFAASVYARVRPGGYAVLTTPSVKMKLWKKHYRHYTKALLQAHMSSGGLVWDSADITALIPCDDERFRFFRRFSHNRLWTIEIPLLNRLAWTYFWKNRIAPDNGTNIVGIFKKPVAP